MALRVSAAKGPPVSLAYKSYNFHSHIIHTVHCELNYKLSVPTNVLFCIFCNLIVNFQNACLLPKDGDLVETRRSKLMIKYTIYRIVHLIVQIEFKFRS